MTQMLELVNKDIKRVIITAFHKFKKIEEWQHASRDMKGLYQYKIHKEFPGGPVVMTPRFHHWGAGFNLWLGN